MHIPCVAVRLGKADFALVALVALALRQRWRPRIARRGVNRAAGVARPVRQHPAHEDRAGEPAIIMDVARPVPAISAFSHETARR